jgi:hypothetical protein
MCVRWTPYVSQSPMPIDLPPWLKSRPDCAELCDTHGRLFLAATFKSAAHLEHFLAIGDLRGPSAIRAEAWRRADPIAAQRERLRKRVYNAKLGLQDAERRAANLRALLSEPSPDSHRSELALRKQAERISQRTSALEQAETELELFDLIPRT